MYKLLIVDDEPLVQIGVKSMINWADYEIEVIGSAFAKRVLEKKGLLENAFLVPIDLHQNLFDNLDSNSKSRADNLFISIDKESRTINVSVKGR